MPLLTIILKQILCYAQFSGLKVYLSSKLYGPLVSVQNNRLKARTLYSCEFVNYLKV